MRTLRARFRDFYGSHPLHLLTMLAGFAVAGYDWGGRAAAGVYFNACERAAVRPLTFTEAEIGAGPDGDRHPGAARP